MPGNSIGQLFRVTTFGESHGPMIGVVIDGCPAGLEIDQEFIQAQMARRKPGQSKITTQRKESDEVEFVAGIFEGKTTGVPIAALIRNEGQREKDYDHLANNYRPSHADFTYDAKYGHRDHRGGGRSSARETAARVLAGAIAQLLLKRQGIQITAYVSQVGSIEVDKDYQKLDFKQIEKSLVRCPDTKTAEKMQELIEGVRKQGDTVGGVVSCVIQGCPAGLGEPVFDRLHADLGKAMLSMR
jgi:chorismate synthase